MDKQTETFLRISDRNEEIAARVQKAVGDVQRRLNHDRDADQNLMATMQQIALTQSELSKAVMRIEGRLADLAETMTTRRSRWLWR